jgi:hypothetical protein
MTGMTESDAPVPPRKPLRRTAWSLLVGGVVALGLMIGVGLLLLAGGEDVGPGRPVMWPAGEQGAVYKLFGVPTTAVVIGLLLFFPRFTLVWARMGNGRFPWRWSGIPDV